MKNQINDKYSLRRIIGILILGALVVSGLSLMLSYQTRQVELEENVAQKMELVKKISQKYDDYEIGIQTEELQTLINKANILKMYLEDDAELANRLSSYAEKQYLSGIVILDQNLRQVKNVDLSGIDNQVMLNRIYGKHQVEKILKFPQMVFADYVYIGEHEYGFAVVARADEKGLIICYQDKTNLSNDKHELSLESMLDISAENSKEVLVVSDGTNIVYSNREWLSGMLVEQCPMNDVVSHDLIPENKNLIKLEFEGKVWYGKADAYRGYYLYIFSQAQWVYPELFKSLAATLGLYLIFALLALLYLQRQKKEEIYQSEREYYMLTAIASIYDVNLLLHLDDNTWEVILQTKAMEREIAGIKYANEMLQVFCDRLMMESARAGFLEFVDLRSLEQRMEGQNSLGYTFEAVDGVWYQALLVPRSRDAENKITTVMLLLRNVTEQTRKDRAYSEQLRIAMEKANEANAAKTDFLRRMSHDIRTPINGIIGMANIGMDAPQDKNLVKDCFEKISYASEFLLELVNNVLDMSKIESGEVEIEHVPFDLREIWKEIRIIVSSQAVGAGIHLEYAELEGSHWNLVGSPLNIQRVIQNIINNAVKYNKPEGSIQVYGREKEYNGTTAVYEFVCKDTGIGMSKEFQEHAFDLFAQEHKTARTTYPGSGLGLSIVKRTVTALGGTVEFASEEGVGTTFVIELPLQVNKDVKSDAKAEYEEKTSLEGVHVLLAEDNELNREIACYMLKEQGIVVSTVENGREAVERFASSAPDTFDVILMDIMMPEMDGLQAAAKIRSMDREDAKKIPIIAASANAFSDDVEASRLSGMNEHLSKPLNYEQVYETIRKYVK